MMNGSFSYKPLSSIVHNRVVISQPMYFPWIGMLQQIRLCDIYVYYDDVQFSRGSFFNRVQIKTAQGIRWLTVPLGGFKLGQSINEVKIDNNRDWQSSQRSQLQQAYADTPFYLDMLNVVDGVFAKDYKYIGELAIASTNALTQYYLSTESKKFLLSSTMNIHGASSKRVIEICSALCAKTYLTGHGARNYLDHEGFEKEGIDVAYINYALEPYPQLHGEFTPYVSSLDLIANCGKDGLKLIQGAPVNWRDFIRKSPEEKG